MKPFGITLKSLQSAVKVQFVDLNMDRSVDMLNASVCC